MKMFDIEVFIGDNQVVLYQKLDGHEPTSIILTPEQAKLVGQWIKDAAEPAMR